MKHQHLLVAAACAALLGAAQAKTTAPKASGPHRPSHASVEAAAAKPSPDSAHAEAERVAQAQVPADTAASATATDAIAPDSAPSAEAAPAAALEAPAVPEAAAAPSVSKPEPARSLPERIAAWERNELGVTIQGQASSRFLQSSSGGKSADINYPTHENVAFSRADILFQARPSAATAGRLEFRLHQDWENYYDEGPNPLLARWFDFSGTILNDKVRFGLGDFRGQYSPLTLWSPGMDIANEPEIFAARRQQAMDEWHLNGNSLPLQGLHADYSDDYTDNLGLKAGFIASRLRTGGAAQTTWLFWTDDVEKLMGAGYLKAELFGGLELGATRLQIVDPVKTARSLNNEYIQVSPTERYEDVTVNAGSLAFDAKRFLQDGPFTARFSAELAQSNYMPAHDVATVVDSVLERRLKQDGSPDSAMVPVLFPRLVKDPQLDGRAIRASLHAGYGESDEGAFGLGLDLAFLQNGKDYVNDVAQSPAFLGRRILNSADSVSGIGGYNSFDAAYDYVYTVDPVTNANTSEFWFPDTKAYNGTNNWYRAPQFKNSYSNQVYTKSERDILARRAMDPTFQLLYPFGPATPNRQGIDAALTAKALQGAVQVTAVFASLKEPDGQVLDSATTGPGRTFGKIGGGVKIDAGKLAGWDKRIVVNGGYVSSNASSPALTYLDTAYAASKLKVDLISAGVSANVWKGLSLLAGFQRAKSDPIRQYAVSGKTKTAETMDLTQDNWALGLEYRVAAGVYATAEYGVMSVDEKKSGTEFTQGLGSASLVVGF